MTTVVYLSTFVTILFHIIQAQEYVVPLYVRADQFGTEHFKLPEPKTGSLKSSYHIEQLIKLESELIGLGEIILETEAKLHANQKLHAGRDKSKKDEVKNPSDKSDVPKHPHNYTRETNYIEKVADMNEKVLKNLQKWVENPLAMFPVRKRLAEEWPYILDNITECSMVSNYDTIYDHFQQVNTRLQKDADIKMAYEDLLRMQKTYKLPVSSLARGWILNEKTEPLSISDIINIAHICLEREDLEGTLEWLLQVAKFLKSLGLQGPDKIKYMNILGGAYLRLDRLQEAKLVYGQLLKEDPKSRIAISNMQLITERIKEDGKKEKKAKEEEKEKDKKKTKTNKHGKKGAFGKEDDAKEENYKEEWWMKYCRGDFKPEWEREKLLKCYVKTIPISGVKYHVEPLSVYPPIYLIKNVLQNFTMSMIVHKASKELSERIQSYSDQSDPSVPIYESEENYWMSKLTYTMKNLTYQKYRVDTHDQFNLLGALRVYNVGAGGTSVPGRGELRVNPYQGWERNYIARYVMFFSSPRAGGHFVFPGTAVHVTPERGDILYWQFRTPWGRVHPKMHQWLECPVLLGNFWYGEQMVEHHNMISQVDFAFNPNEFYIPEELLKPKKKTVKKKKVMSKDSEEDEEEVEEKKTTKKDKQTNEDDVDEEELAEAKKNILKKLKKKSEKLAGGKEEEEEEPEEEPVKKKVVKKKIVKKSDVEAAKAEEKKQEEIKKTQAEEPKKKLVKKVKKKKVVKKN